MNSPIPSNSYPLNAICAVCGEPWDMHVGIACPLPHKTHFVLAGSLGRWCCYSYDISTNRYLTRGADAFDLQSAEDFYIRHGWNKFLWAEPMEQSDAWFNTKGGTVKERLVEAGIFSGTSNPQSIPTPGPRKPKIEVPWECNRDPNA